MPIPALMPLAPWFNRARHSALAFPLAVLAAALMVGISESAYRRADARLGELVDMGRARLQVYQVLIRVTEAESGKRGYMLANGPEYLANYRNAHRDVRLALEGLRKFYVDAGDVGAEAERKQLENVVNAKLSELSEVLELFDRGEHAKALEIVRSGIGRDLMEQVRTRAMALLEHQNRTIATGLQSVNDTLMLGRVGVSAMTALSLLVLGLFLRQGRALLQAQRAREELVSAERDRLEAEVGRRTAELTELARHLQTAREDERARLARELHDELGALLTAAKLDVARIRPKLQLAAPDLVPRLAHLTEALNGGIALKRRIIEDLRPSTLSSLGLIPALEILCAEFAERAGLKVQATLEPVALAPSAELTVFRLVQEAFTNVAKYAHAHEVQVRLGPDGAQARVSVRDDGRGFDLGKAGQGSHGLVGMRFRVRAEGGELDVRSAPGQGTTLEARLPVRAA